VSRIISRGSVRVDALRAVEKLREHLLVDLHLYLLELVRAAIAGKATQIDLRYDADDVTLTFDGAPLPKTALGRLLDHVLDEAASPEARRVRLFALGVNAALGLAPAYVDLFQRDAEVCTRVRWTPDLLDPSGAGAARLPLPEPISPKEGMAPGTTRVEVRRRLGWGVLKKALSGSAPREIELLVHAVHASAHLPAKLTLEGRPFPFAVRAPALVSVPFDLPGVRRAALEIVPAGAGPPVIELLEHSVCLIRSPLDFAPEFPSQPFLGVELPVRVTIDAEALPTNASRSSLREDAPLGRQIQKAAFGALLDAVLALSAVVTGKSEAPAGVEILPGAQEPALEDALGAVACVVRGAVGAGASVPSRLGAVLSLPLLRDGAGAPLGLAAIRATKAEPLYLWKRPEPIPEELWPFLKRAVWIRGRVAERMLSGLPVADATALLDDAKRGAARRRKFLESAPSEPVLPADCDLGETPIRSAFHVLSGELAGLRGEVAIVADSIEPRRIHVFVEERLLETVALDRSVIPLPIEMAIAWEGHLRARFAYDAVEEDEAYRWAVYHAIQVAACSLEEQSQKPDALPVALSRAAIGALSIAPARLGIERMPGRVPPLSAFAGLYRAPVWPTTEQGRWESLSRLAEVKGAVCIAASGATGRAADGRPVVAVTPREARWLAAALKVDLVPYDAALLEGGGKGKKAREQRIGWVLDHIIGEDAVWQRGPVLAIAWPGLQARITLSGSPRAVFCHAGRVLCSSELTPGALVIALDDDSIVPTPEWDGMRWQAAPGVLRALERAFCERVVAALSGDRKARAEFDPDRLELRSVLCNYLIDSAVALAARASPEDASLAAQIGQIPLFTTLDERGAPRPTSLAELAAFHPPPQPVPVLGAPPGFETLTWRPVIASELTSLERWAGGRIVMAESELPARLGQAYAEQELRAFLSGPEQDPRDLGELAPPGERSVFLEATAKEGISVAVASSKAPSPADSFNRERAVVDVLFRRRALCRKTLGSLPIPVVARVDLSDRDHIVGYSELTHQGIWLVTDQVHAAARLLAYDLIDRAIASGQGGMFFGDLRALRLLLGVLRAAPASPAVNAVRTLDDLILLLSGEALRWPTVQGEEHPLGAIQTADGELLAGHHAYLPWHRADADRPTDLDDPILFLPEGPEGDTLKAILKAIGREVRDVTAKLERLQGYRAEALPLAVPKLPGTPAHPALRVNLKDLGIHAADGELEIIAGPASEVRLLDEVDPIPRLVSASLPFPMRILARAASADPGRDSTRALLRKIASAGGRHLLAQRVRLDELPTFVRDHLRSMVCQAVERGKRIGKRASGVPIFPDTLGTFHPYAEIAQDPGLEWGVTTAPPPYPQRVYGIVVLCLSDTELDQIKGTIRLRNVTTLLRRDLEGERRASAPQVAEIALAPGIRDQCVRVLSLPEGSAMTGEVGLLAPEHTAARGIAVHVNHRPVCVLNDGLGWPLAAIVNDDTLVVNRYFDGLTLGGASRVRARVREVADLALRAQLAPPEDALAVRWIDGSEIVAEGISIAGVLFLPAAWPEEPRVLVRLSGSLVKPLPRPLVVSEAPPYLFGEVPIAGELLVSAGAPGHAVATFALRAAAAMVEEAMKAGKQSEALSAYQWNLRLLGFSEAGTPSAPTADGASVGPSAVLVELATRGALWVALERGSIDGDYPKPDALPPSFVLASGSALSLVLHHRALPGVLRELGAFADDVEVTLESEAPSFTSALLSLREELQAAPVSTRPEPSSGSWGGELWQAVRAFFLRDGWRDEAEAIETPLCLALLSAIAELDLPGRPVREVREARSGRPLRFDEERGRLTLNPRHRALFWWTPERAADPRAFILLLAAAVSEIHRAFPGVVDGAERRALGVLLARVSA
jgi:hypothetical protein